MSTPTTVKAPIHFVRICISEALNHTRYSDDAEALTRLEAATREANTAIIRVGDAFAPASLVLTAATQGAESARRALLDGNSAEAIGALRATLAALNNVPAIIEAHVEDDEEGRA